ncbi:MAG: VWA domain-containing protein [Gallionella sp.]|nr:VWA domain-containing protein [Gallionella sp.]
MNPIFQTLPHHTAQLASSFPPGQGVTPHTSSMGVSPVIAGCNNAPRLKTYLDQLANLVIDDSGSMSGGKAAEANRAGTALMAELDNPKNKDGFRVSLIRFGSTALLEGEALPPSGVSFNFNGSSGGTMGAPGLLLAKRSIEKYSARPDRRLTSPVVVFMSDGGLADSAHTLQVADEIKQKLGGTIISIGFGSDVDEAILKQIASSPQHYSFAQVGNLTGLFAQVGKTMTNSLQQVR